MDNKNLTKDASSIILAHEGDENFEVDAEQETHLLYAIAEADRGELIRATDLLERICHE